MIGHKDIGIDLGTANSLVYLKGKGIVLREPSVVAVNLDNNKILAVGSEAQKMIGRTPGNIVAIRPMKDGVIADFETTYNMIKYFLKQIPEIGGFLSKKRVVICVPADVTSVEERAVKEAAIQAGASEAYIVEEPMAAAIGANLPVEEPTGSMIVDIGGGTTDVAVISLGGIVASKSIRTAGDELNTAIINYIKKQYNLMIGEPTAEDIKVSIGSAFPTKEGKTYRVKGRDMVTGLPKNIEVTEEEIYHALQETVLKLLEAIKSCLEKTPPELASDIMDRGIVLAGGGALLRGLDSLISENTGIPVFVAEDPLSSVVLGTSKIIDNIDKLKGVISKKRYTRR